MDRRVFIKAAGALSLASATPAAERGFDPTEQSIPTLQRALASGVVTSESLTATYLGRTGAAAIAGHPSLTVPAGLVNGLPVGITLVGNRNQDCLLLQVARAYERAAAARQPPHLRI